MYNKRSIFICIPIPPRKYTVQIARRHLVASSLEVIYGASTVGTRYTGAAKS